MDAEPAVRLRPLERSDLPFVHSVSNDSQAMSYWFEEPFESLAELIEIYERHIHDVRERRFIIEHDGQQAGIVELVEIDYIHRNCEFAIAVVPQFQGFGLVQGAVLAGLRHAFDILNLHKVYLLVDAENVKAVHIYEKAGFVAEGVLREEYFAAGSYRDAVRMAIFQRDYQARDEQGRG
ncbi:Diamine N-acetyltransferase [Segniliparus rotundus DSM 44985]|uniref:Diamine N-acetyltransferase n=1 Tax=Segniliparus rotundus (strain ATCC BAA-972 / CDC 1076 / CIP 108378 / DSM 44985 / JCM 13578) TaxID=640132 RepID=D6ZCS5_SEGRD|nr:spermidine N1-acetyltransferase [Segniliparus rotundus]ADG97117.1 Diamine N-acetyltransferase [Segniliparus rotundus DSM 44985]